jgi:hypothetical protein
VLEQMVADAPDLAGVLTAALALAHAEADGLEEASQLLEDFAAAGFDLPFDPVWLLTMAEWADVAIVCRHRECAGPLLDRLVPWESQSCLAPVAYEGLVSLYLGGLATVLGRYDEADAYFAQSSAYSSRVGAKFVAARTDHLWGAMFAERQAPGDIEKARFHLTTAHSVAADNGYGAIERRAADALQLLDD